MSSVHFATVKTLLHFFTLVLQQSLYSGRGGQPDVPAGTGKKVNVSRNTIHRIESEKQEPLVSLAIALAEVFDVTVEDMFKLHPVPASPWRADPWTTSKKRKRNGKIQAAESRR